MPWKCGAWEPSPLFVSQVLITDMGDSVGEFKIGRPREPTLSTSFATLGALAQQDRHIYFNDLRDE